MNTKLDKAYGTILDSYKDNYQRDYVGKKLLDNITFSLEKAKNTRDEVEKLYANEHANCSHTGQATAKLQSLSNRRKYITVNIADIEENKVAIEKALESFSITISPHKTLAEFDAPKVVPQEQISIDEQARYEIDSTK